MAGIRTCDRESQVQRPNHYTTEPPSVNNEHLYAATVLYQFNKAFTDLQHESVSYQRLLS